MVEHSSEQSGGCFIPWDDDLDICIFEEDYNRAIECLTDKEKGLSGGAVLQCAKTDPNYYLGWMKIRDQYSHTYPDAPRFRENGVWIDLYKMVKAKKSDVPVLVAQEAIDYLNRRLAAGGLTQAEYDARIKNGRLYEKLDAAKRAHAENPVKGTDPNVYIIWSASKVVLEEGWIEPLKKVTFEGLEVTTFGKAEEYLEQHYGAGYHEFPPDEDRRIGITRIERKAPGI